MAYTTIKKPSDYFNTKLYSGNSSTQNITGVGFQPDWTWIKQRNGTNYHTVFDIVRGATKRIFPNATDAEDTAGSSLTSFNSDGFTLDANAGVNGTGNTFVSWNWLASNTTASNTDGSITSTVSANTTSGFSIVSWTGNGNLATIGHGLGVTPSMYIVKNRSIVESWVVYHKDLNGGSTPEDFHLLLEGTNAEANYPVWNDTAPTSSVFTVNNFALTNGNTNNMLAYCFAEKKGFSKFGSYTGNGSTDGTFVYTGFKPAFVIVKKSSGTGNWMMMDNVRNTFNVIGERLKANAADAGASDTYQDHLSNGFKIRTTADSWNTSGDTYIYMAFAEEPLVGDNPATAR